MPTPKPSGGVAEVCELESRAFAFKIDQRIADDGWRIARTFQFGIYDFLVACEHRPHARSFDSLMKDIGFAITTKCLTIFEPRIICVVCLTFVSPHLVTSDEYPLARDSRMERDKDFQWNRGALGDNNPPVPLNEAENGQSSAQWIESSRPVA